MIAFFLKVPISLNSQFCNISRNQIMTPLFKMTFKLSTASIFRTRYLANRSAGPVEFSSVSPFLEEVSLEDKSNTYPHSKCSSQITTWTPFYSSIKMVYPVSHIFYLLAEFESFPEIPNNPYFVVRGHASNWHRKKTGKPMENACKFLGTSPRLTRRSSKNAKKLIPRENRIWDRILRKKHLEWKFFE